MSIHDVRLFLNKTLQQSHFSSVWLFCELLTWSFSIEKGSHSCHTFVLQMQFGVEWEVNAVVHTFSPLQRPCCLHLTYPRCGSNAQLVCVECKYRVLYNYSAIVQTWDHASLFHLHYLQSPFRKHLVQRLMSMIKWQEKWQLWLQHWSRNL